MGDDLVGDEAALADEDEIELDFFAANVALTEAQVLDVATMELLVRVERSGEAFYEAMAQRIGNDEAATLLRRNGREEEGHARRVQRALALKVGEGYEPPASASVRFEIDLPERIDPSILPIIFEAEMKGDAGYQAWADAEQDPEVARLLRLNGREETKHAERIRRVMELLDAPAT